MYQIIQHAHSGWAYIVVATVLALFIYTLYLFFTKTNYSESYKKVSKFAVLAVHVQFVLGIILLFISPITVSAFSNMGATMKDSTLRLYAVEHPFMMLLAVVFITIANAKIKRNQNITMPIFVMVSLVLFLILSRIPYAAWLSFLG